MLFLKAVQRGMEEKTTPQYIACRNCGTYIGPEEAVENRYCSEPCSLQYECCVVCGNFFVQKAGQKKQVCENPCGEDLVKYLDEQDASKLLEEAL